MDESTQKMNEIIPKNTRVTLIRKKQFATLNSATKTHVEIGINLCSKSPTPCVRTKSILLT